jgi:hypothetical protein
VPCENCLCAHTVRLAAFASSKKIKAAVKSVRDGKKQAKPEKRVSLQMARSLSHPSVFINCPFDPEFQPFLRAILKQVTPRRSRRKTCLIFVKDSRNLSFITDINGMDVQGHGDRPVKSIESIRNWLCNDAKMDGQPASVIAQLFKKFESEFPEIMKRIGY